MEKQLTHLTGITSAGRLPPSRAGWLRRLFGYCWRHKRDAFLSFGASLAAVAVTAMVPLVTRLIIDDAIAAHHRPLAPWAVLLVLAAFGAFGLAFVQRYFAGRLAAGVQHDLRTDLFRSLTRLDGAQQDRLSTGEVVGRATSDLQLVNGLLSMMPLLAGNMLLFGASVAAMLWLSPLLTVIAAVTGSCLWWCALRSRKRLYPASWAVQQESATVAGVVDQAITGVRVIKGFGQEERELGRLQQASRRLLEARIHTIRLSARWTPAMQTIPVLGQVALLALGGWLAIDGHITLGTFTAFAAYQAQMTGPIRMLTMLVALGQQDRAGMERVLQLIDQSPTVREAPGATVLSIAQSKALAGGHTRRAALEFDHVTFAYPAAERTALPDRPGLGEPVLRDLSLHIARGETLAMVGASGSGKSTAGMLVPRFYDTTAGTVRVFGHDVRDLTLDSLRSAIGIVPQDSFLFSESVRTNIAFGRPEASDAEIQAAARAAQADSFIRDLPNGYDTTIGEQGLTLSGGQRQRIALARAILAAPPILILDDATSAVDTQTEADIHSSLQSVMRERATLLITHRRSSLRLADRIAVLDHGRLVDIGTHEELDARCPLYQALLAESDSEAPAANVTFTQRAADPTVSFAASDTLGPTQKTAAKEPVPLRHRVRCPGHDGQHASTSSRSGNKSHQHGGVPAAPDMLAATPPSAIPHPPPRRARTSESNFALRQLLLPFRRAFFLALLLVTLDAVVGLLFPVLLRHGINEGISKNQIGGVVVAAVAALTVAVLGWALQNAEARVSGRTAERILHSLRIKVFAHLQRLGLDYYERERAGYIMTRMTTDVESLSTFVQSALVTAVVSLFTFLGVLAALLVIDVQLTVVVLTMLPVLVVATLIFRRKSATQYQLARQKVSTVNAELQENVAGMRIIQAFRREGAHTARFTSRSTEHRNTVTRAHRYAALYFPLVHFLSSTAAAIALIVGAQRIAAGTLTAGTLVAYLLYIELLFAPIQQISQVFDSYQQASVGLVRIRELLHTPPSTPLHAANLPVRRLRGEIHLDNIQFTYNTGNTHEPEALTGIDLHIPAGQTVALVGESGAGKSTLIKLIARFYDVTGGTIRLDGTDIRQYDLTAYRRRLGLVPQETHLFPGSVRETIAYGRPEATDAEIEAAVRRIGAHEMITRLPDGYLHHISERGRNLSAGQRQLIALARAELVDPDVLLLDEPTAALDPVSEAAVIQAAARLIGRRTTLVIAHRLDTAVRADRVLVLERGRIVEDGTHAELLTADSTYARLWRAFQSKNPKFPAEKVQGERAAPIQGR
ncbi:ABC transporter ATP-binding protein [Streptomyces chartreusis]|uniref:ABC transporter ATP-binding protein n=1 Tax=Streptomyces chartreusis TaxID=1969 RepID=UPI00381534AF